MKLATRKNGTRDGELVVVSRDLTTAAAVPDIARTMQAALDDWDALAPRLQAVYEQLNDGAAAGAESFVETDCESPLPRAYHWADGSAYVNHVELVRKARGAEMPPSFWEDPLMYQGGSDDFLGPREAIDCLSDQWGIDFEGEIAVITDDVPMGVTPQQAEQHIKLLMLVNDVSLRGLIPGELGKGFGFYQSKPATAFSPVAVTPDELGSAWNDSRVHGPLLSQFNDQPFGKPDAGVDMIFSFADLVAHAARTRRLGTGTIVGSGTVSNKQGTDHGTAIAEGGVGYSCLAEIRMIETIRDGKSTTPFMTFGDRIRIEMLDNQGHTIFGAIDQQVVKAEAGGGH